MMSWPPQGPRMKFFDEINAKDIFMLFFGYLLGQFSIKQIWAQREKINEFIDKHDFKLIFHFGILFPISLIIYHGIFDIGWFVLIPIGILVASIVYFGMLVFGLAIFFLEMLKG